MLLLSPLPPSFLFEILTRNVMVLECGAFGKEPGHYDRDFMNDTNILKTGPPVSSLSIVLRIQEETSNPQYSEESQ